MFAILASAFVSQKAILTRLRSGCRRGRTSFGYCYGKEITSSLSEMGRVARMHLGVTLPRQRSYRNSTALVWRLFLSWQKTSRFVTENDDYYQAAAIDTLGNEKQIRARACKDNQKHGELRYRGRIAQKLDYEHPSNIAALATVSKIVSLNDQWGLAKWPAVNPKNIRDKIYVVLTRIALPMHFSDIASEFDMNPPKRRRHHNEWSGARKNGTTLCCT